MSTVSTSFTAAARLLLNHGLLTPDNDGWSQTYIWRTELREFFRRIAAADVQVGPDVIRLVLPPPFPEGGRVWSGIKSPKAAALTVWVLWYHEYLGMQVGEVRQFTLSELATAIASQPQAANLQFTQLADRQALIQAVKALRDYGALRILDSEAGWEESSDQTQGGALLEFTPAAAYLIASASAVSPTPAQRAVRSLLTGPVLSRAQDPEAFAALTEPEVAEVSDVLGWHLEQQLDYALLRREGQVYGVATRWDPARSTDGVIGLLLLEALRAEVQAGHLAPDDTGRLTVSHNRLYALLEEVKSQHRTKWGERGKANTEKLLEAAVSHWRVWGGIAVDDGTIMTLEPHLSRFGATYEPEALLSQQSAQPIPVERLFGS